MGERGIEGKDGVLIFTLGVLQGESLTLTLNFPPIELINVIRLHKKHEVENKGVLMFISLHV